MGKDYKGKLTLLIFAVDEAADAPKTIHNNPKP